MSFSTGSVDDEGLISIFASRCEDPEQYHDDSSNQHYNPGVSSTSSNDTNSSTAFSATDLQKDEESEFPPHDVRPDVAEEFKPNELMRFRIVDDAVAMYKSYALKAGFDVRLNTTRKVGGVVKHKWLVCSRNGKPVKKSVDAQRNTYYKVSDCKAKIIVKLIPKTGNYKFEKFQEMHNHELEDEIHLRERRKMSYTEKEYIIRAGTVKIGATSAHKMKAAFKGGFEYVNPKKVDFKNFKRNVGSIIGFRDAQLFVNRMKDRVENYPNFSFYYRCDENSVLNAMFWADETEKAYCCEFGDVVSLDATFRTNKYSLVFVPFTVVDHHGSSVTVGAGLLSTETIDSYKWLLQQFLNAHGKQPVFVLSDQDPALKQAIESVFPNSNHRLCMWHILKKLHSKLTSEFLKTTSFEEDFKKLVWNMNVEPAEFEKKWDLLMKEHKLEEDNWFKEIFKIRKAWIPAYFKEIQMCGLMKTTSRSESMNSFFNSYSQSDNFLVNFLMNYDNAIQKLRNTQRELDHKTKIAKYIYKTPRKIEKHAAEVYTSRVFFDVQKQMHKAAWFCEDTYLSKEDGWEVYKVIHMNKKSEYKLKFKVKLNVAEKEIDCNCGHFKRYGVLCRHAFKILMKKDFKEIPERYILRRWRKDVIYANYQLSRDRFDESDAETNKLVNNGYFIFESSIDLIRHDKEKLAVFFEKQSSLLKELKSDPSNVVMSKDVDVVEKLLGVPIPKEVEINNPNVQHNKGCGKKRLVGELEKSIVQAQKKTKMCHGCNQRIPHNSRTCPIALAKKAAALKLAAEKKAATEKLAAEKSKKKK